MLSDQTRLTHWLENLPLTNIDKSAKAVYQALLAYRKEKTSAQNMFDTLEAFRPTIDYLTNSLYDGYLSEQQSDKKRQMVNWIQKLQYELASFYLKTVLNEMNVEPTLTAMCMHRAITHLTKILFHCYHLY